MLPLVKILLMLFLILIGISMSSNNFIHQFIVLTFFKQNSLATKLIRPLGILIALSSVLLITEYKDIGIIINLFIGMFFVFSYISNQNELRKRQSNTRERTIQQYQSEIDERRKYIEKLKHTIEKNNEEQQTKELLKVIKDSTNDDNDKNDNDKNDKE